MTPLEIVLSVALVLMLALAIVAAWRWLVLSARVDRLDEGMALAIAALEGGTAGYIVWPAAGGEQATPSLVAVIGTGAADFAGLKALFAAEDAARLETLAHALRTRGEEFERTLTTADGRRSLHFEGRRGIGAAADYLWLHDVTAASARTAELAGRLSALAAERDGLLAVLDALPIPVWRRRADLRLERVNRAYAEAMDSDPDAVVAEERELAAGVIGMRGRELADRTVRTGVAQSESRHVVVGGRRRLMEFAEIATDGDSVVGYAIDRTDLEDAQAQMSRHIAAHADVLENVTVAIAIYDRDTRLEFYNTALARLWDVDTKWLDSKPSLAEFLEHLREKRRLPEFVDFRAFKEDQLKLFTSLIEPNEDLMHLPDGRTLRVREVPHPFGGLLFTYEDVTDRLALERNYNTLIEVQRRSLDNLYEGVALIGADGRLKLSNPAYARLWQLAEADLEGEPHIADLIEKCRDFFVLDGEWPELKQRVIARMTGREARAGRLERGDGSVLEYANVPLPDGAVLLSYIDVTDRFRVERALRERTQALEAADRVKTEFIANVSYELRTPLTSIIGFTEILERESVGPLNDKQREYLDGVLKSSQALLGLINDILDLATIDAGYMALAPSRIDVHALLRGIYDLTGEQARRQQLKTRFQCRRDVGTMVADERRLRQILVNLMSNAINFTPQGGTITLGAKREGDAMVFAISDTGIGIPEEEQRRVLQMFERGSQPMVRQPGAGAGLGLSLVKSLVELHGGTVEISSKPDRGTRVVCRLPVAADMAVAAGAA